MNDTATPAFDGDFAKLTESYLVRLEQSVEVIDNILGQHQMGKLKKDDFLRAQSLAHGLAGSGAMFGFPEITEVARTADLYILDLLKQAPDANIPDKDYTEFEKIMIHLRKACDRNAHSQERGQANKFLDGVKLQALPKTFHVVVVDDDVQLNTFLSEHLKRRGILVTVAENGAAALREIKRNPPDLVILDVSMPDMNGHEVLRELKQTPQLVSIPIFMLTGNTQRTDEVTAMHAGAIDYIIKPYDPEKLIERVENVLNAARYTVMIVDNDELVQQLVDSKFRYAGFKTILISDGKEAWDRILKEVPDLIILDRMMPGMEGLAVLKNIRSEKATAKIPVIILSARQEQRDIEMGLQMGAQEYIIKPFTTDDLLQRSLEILNKEKLGVRRN